MSLLRQTLHVLRKDLRKGAWILGFFAGATTLVSMLTVRGVFMPELAFLGFAIALLGVLGIAVVVQDDPPGGPRALWRTLPLRPAAVASAKVGLVLFMAGLLTIALRLPWVLSHDVEATVVMTRLARHFGLSIAILGFVGLIAAFTPNLRVFWVVLIVTGAVWSFAKGSVDARFPEPAPPARAVAPVGANPTAWPEALTLRVLPVGTSRSVGVELELTGSADAYRYAFRIESMEIHPSEGDSIIVPAREGLVALVTTSRIEGGPLDWLGSLEGTDQRIGILLEPEEREAARAPGTRFVFHGSLTSLRSLLDEAIPLTGGSEAGEGHRVEVQGYELEDDQPAIHIVHSTAFDLSSGMDGWRVHGEPRGLAFLLSHPGRREALPLTGWSGSAASGGFASPGDVRRATIRASRIASRAWDMDEEGPRIGLQWMEEAELQVLEWTTDGHHRVEAAPLETDRPPPGPNGAAPPGSVRPQVRR